MKRVSRLFRDATGNTLALLAGVLAVVLAYYVSGLFFAIIALAVLVHFIYLVLVFVWDQRRRRQQWRKLDPFSAAGQAFVDALWRTVVPGRNPEEVATTLRSSGITNALDGARVLLRDADSANIVTARLNQRDPNGQPLAPNLLVLGLAASLQRAGLPLDDEGTTP